MPSSPKASDLQLLDGNAYVKALLKTIPQAKKRVVVAAMVMLSGEKTDQVFEVLKKAAQRGVSVRVLIDNYTRFMGLLNKADKGRIRLKRTFTTLEELSGLGARVYYFGRIGLIPYKGRCHLKISIVDDDVFSFGGINFNDEDFQRADYMLHTQSRTYADCLEELVKRVGGAQPPLANGEVEIDETATILFDGGKPHDPGIYEKACELTAQALKVHYVSHMAPSSKLAHLLQETNATIYTSRPDQMPAPNSWGQAYDLQKYRLTNSYTRTTELHAKFILFELPGGRRALLSGSHNFSYRGVAFGTQEMALYSTDKALWGQLYKFLEKHVA
jgi:cardiolipin synthase A/B